MVEALVQGGKADLRGPALRPGIGLPAEVVMGAVGRGLAGEQEVEEVVFVEGGHL